MSMSDEQAVALLALSNAFTIVTAVGLASARKEVVDHAYELLRAGSHRLRMTVEANPTYVEVALVSFDGKDVESLFTIRDEGH